jgi:hypothetical protein
MAKLIYTRASVASLVEVLEGRATSVLLRDQPQLQTDLLASAALLRWMVERGVPITRAEVSIVRPPLIVGVPRQRTPDEINFGEIAAEIVQRFQARREYSWLAEAIEEALVNAFQAGRRI